MSRKRRTGCVTATRARKRPRGMPVERHRQIVAEALGDARVELLQHHAGDRRHVELLGLGDRHPDQFDQFGVGTVTPSTRCAIALASTVKKRASNRRGRPGGVMARPMKCSAPRSGRTWPRRTPSTGRPECRRRSSLRRRAAAGLLEGLADRGERQRARLARRSAAARAASGCASACGIERSSRPACAGRPARRRPPGNTNLPGMNLWPRMALAEQHLRHAAGAVDQDQRRGILAAAHCGMAEVALDLVHPLDEAVIRSRRSACTSLIVRRCLARCARPWRARDAWHAPRPSRCRPVIAPFGQKLESQRAGDRRRLDQPHRDARRRAGRSRRCGRRSGRGDPRDSGNTRRRWCAPG